MAKKKVRTTAQRRAAAKEAWRVRKMEMEVDAANLKRAHKPHKTTVPNVNFSEDFGSEPTRVDAPFCAPGYDALRRELHAAYEQSAYGKGKERHANDRPFDKQPIAELSRMHGPGFATGQAAKKAQEALGMLSRGDAIPAIAELHGAIVYLAAAAMIIREG